MRPLNIYLVLVIVHLLWTPVLTVKWLALALVDPVTPVTDKPDCSHMDILDKNQKGVCKRHLEVMGAVARGAKLALDECQYQFRFRRWNCSFLSPEHVVSGAILNEETRELAYTHAISSAGVAFSVTRSCSLGALQTCGCDESLRDTTHGFKWAGCSDNIVYGTAFAQEFVDARERVRGRDANKGLVNLHNNRAGRQVLLDHMETECKCHGVSGSCEVKTCWRTMPHFRKLGILLKEKFDSASKVRVRKKKSRKKLIPSNRNYKPFTATDLVYLKQSPDFCDANPALGSLGTKGRLCNADSRGMDGCELMCCSRGYTTERKSVEQRCNCKFYWCCTVHCDKCMVQVVEHFCL